MKNLLFSIFTFLLLATPGSRLFAQQANISIHGKVTSTDDNQPVQGVSISIDKKGIGTSTNASGMYALSVPAANVNDTLKISSIGFKTRQYPIAALKNGQVLNVLIEKNNTELKEVTIGYYDADKIIQKALTRISLNYINHPHIIHGFYRMYTFNAANPLELTEAVFDVYNLGYTDKRADQFKLVKARSGKNERDFNTLELGQKPNSVFEYDIVNHIYASGILNDEGLTKHKFEVKGVVDINGYKAYQINFKEKTADLDGTFRGRMYIDTKTYAFIYFDFGLSPQGLKYMSAGTFAKHALMKTGRSVLEHISDHTKVRYQEVGNKWVLANVEGDDVVHVQNQDLKYDFNAHVKFNYQVTAVDTNQNVVFNTKMGRNENINDHGSDESDKFWNDYNIILSDYNAEDIFKQLKAINKENKQKK